MRAWFYSLQPRERLISIGGAVVVVLMILWFGVLHPLRTQSELLRNSIGTKQRLLVDLRRLGAPTGPAPTTRGLGQTLVVLIDTSAKEHGIALTRSRPDGPDGVQVAFGNTSFDTLLDWLVTLEKQNAVAVESASFTSARQRGVVNGQLLLRRP